MDTNCMSILLIILFEGFLRILCENIQNMTSCLSSSNNNNVFSKPLSCPDDCVIFVTKAFVGDGSKKDHRFCDEPSHDTGTLISQVTEMTDIFRGKCNTFNQCTLTKQQLNYTYLDTDYIFVEFICEQSPRNAGFINLNRTQSEQASGPAVVIQSSSYASAYILAEDTDCVIDIAPSSDIHQIRMDIKEFMYTSPDAPDGNTYSLTWGKSSTNAEKGGIPKTWIDNDHHTIMLRKRSNSSIKIRMYLMLTGLHKDMSLADDNFMVTCQNATGLPTTESTMVLSASDTSNKGAIAGGTIGGVVALVIIVIVLLVVFIKRKPRHESGYTKRYNSLFSKNVSTALRLGAKSRDDPHINADRHVYANDDENNVHEYANGYEKHEYANDMQPYVIKPGRGPETETETVYSTINDSAIFQISHPEVQSPKPLPGYSLVKPPYTLVNKIKNKPLNPQNAAVKSHQVAPGPKDLYSLPTKKKQRLSPGIGYELQIVENNIYKY